MKWVVESTGWIYWPLKDKPSLNFALKSF